MLPVLLIHLGHIHMPIEVASYSHAGVAQEPRHHLELGPTLKHRGGIEVPELVGVNVLYIANVTYLS